jgi:hypothetical protein
MWLFCIRGAVLNAGSRDVSDTLTETRLNLCAVNGRPRRIALWAFLPHSLRNIPSLLKPSFTTVITSLIVRQVHWLAHSLATEIVQQLAVIYIKDDYH